MPVCDVRHNSSSSTPTARAPCATKWLNRTASSSATVQHVQLLSLNPSSAGANPNCTCPAKTHHLARHHGQSVCIPLPLINDFLAYNSFALTAKPASAATAAAALYGDLATLTFFCRTMRETRACNHLANLCVLHRYRRQPRYSPCTLFQPPVDQRPQLPPGLKKSSAASGQQAVYVDDDDDDDDDEDSFRIKRSIRYPRLFVAAPGKDTVDLWTTKLEHAYGLHGTSRYMQLIQHRYGLSGELRAMQPLSIGDLNACAATVSAENQRHIHFGRNVRSNCRVNVVRLMDQLGRDGAGEFVEVLLNYTEAKIDVMRPIPVLVRDAAAFEENAKADQDKWQLVSRFVTFDTFTELDNSPRPAVSLFSTAARLQQFRSVRYVRNIELQIRIDGSHTERPNRIFAPLLVIDYATLNTTALLTSDARAYVEFSYAVSFTKPSSQQVQQVLDICLYVYVSLAVLHTLLQTYRYKTRQQRQFCDVDTCGRCVGFLAGNVAVALFWTVLTVAGWCVWTAYGADASTLRLLMPIDAVQQRLLDVLLYVSVPLKAALVGQQLWRLCQVDVFFVDWERPRGNDGHYNAKSTGLHGMLDNATTSASVSSVGQHHNGGAYGEAGVSAWRTYFVANEWLRLGTQRKCSVLVHSVLVGGALLSLDYRLVSGDVLAQRDRTVTLASTAVVYVLAYVAQRVLGRWLIGQRLVGRSPAPRRFVDVCSVANVSVFVLQLETFGYYVHGRSPHGFADSDQTSMLMQLRREQEHTMGHRGLLLTSEQQTFAFLVPANLR